MFNVTTIVESVRRHLVAIIIITALALAAGVGASLFRTSSEEAAVQNTAYTAEAAIFVTPAIFDASQVSSNNDYLITDARRTVVGDSVAGEVRRTYGDGIKVTSPFWVDSEKGSRLYSRYVFVDVSAPTEEMALEAANFAANLAVQKMKDTLPVDDAVVADPAYLRSDTGFKAAERGSDQMTQIASGVQTSKSISVKKLFIFGFAGLVGAILVFACWDILSRRVRSERDVERLTDISVLGSLCSQDDYVRAAAGVDVLIARNQLDNVAIAGASDADNAAQVGKRLAEHLETPVQSIVSLEKPDSVAKLAKADAVLLVLGEAAAKGSQIQDALKTLRMIDVPVAGAVFVPKDKTAKAAKTKK